MVDYEASIKDLRIIDFHFSGHMILDEELGKACKYISEMLDMVDASEIPHDSNIS